eukprot:726522-Hanusia_phi.AAC.1
MRGWLSKWGGSRVTIGGMNRPRLLELVRTIPPGTTPTDGKGGVGISFSPNRDGDHVIQSMVPTGSANKCGKVRLECPVPPSHTNQIRQGDIILKVNGKPVKGLPIRDVVDLIKGPKDTKVKLEVFTPSVQPASPNPPPSSQPQPEAAVPYQRVMMADEAVLTYEGLPRGPGQSTSSSPQVAPVPTAQSNEFPVRSSNANDVPSKNAPADQKAAPAVKDLRDSPSDSNVSAARANVSDLQLCWSADSSQAVLPGPSAGG